MRTHFAAVSLESQICGACALILPLCPLEDTCEKGEFAVVSKREY